jgi:hypothetical protein
LTTAKYYSLTERLAVEETIVLFKGTATVTQYTPKKHKQFEIKLYKLCDSKGYTYDTTVHLGKYRKRANSSLTATNAIVTGLTARTEHVGHKMYLDDFFSSLALF